MGRGLIIAFSDTPTWRHISNMVRLRQSQGYTVSRVDVPDDVARRLVHEADPEGDYYGAELKIMGYPVHKNPNLEKNHVSVVCNTYFDE